MMVIPAIDLMKGKVVRLSRGDSSTAKFYDHWGTPAQIAIKWKSQGAKRLHIIDLDAAFGTGDNTTVIGEIVRASSLPIQVGGGIRTIATAAKLFKTGISHVILGALALSDSSAIGKIQKQFGAESVIVALDNKDGRVMVQGWKNPKGNIVQDVVRRRKRVILTELTVKKALENFTALGVERFLITSIAQDGMLQGPDLDTLREAATYPNVKIIAAGGIGSLNDLVALKRIGVEGTVVGKALYEGRFTLKEAIETVEAN